MIGDVRRFPTRAASGWLPRAASDDPPVGQRAGPARPHIEGGPGRRPPRARRGGLVGGQEPRPLRAFAQRTAAGAAGTSRPSRSRASSPSLPGTCSPAARTTPSRARASCAEDPRARARRRRAARQARAEAPTPSGTPATTLPSCGSPSRPRSPTAAWSATGRPAARRRVRARHRSAHLKGPRRARPRGRPQAPDACTSPRQSPAPRSAASHKEPERARQFDFHP